MSTEWRNWEEVTRHVLPDRRLFRSSAPNYGSSPQSQHVTDSAIAFLVQNGISTIVSFKDIPYTADEQARVKEAGISYHHFPVEDFTAPTFEQLQSVVQVFNDLKPPQASMLVHCGYGHGRTGTGVTALQLFATKGTQPPESEWVKDNHVETGAQIDMLRRLRDHYRSSEFMFRYEVNQLASWGCLLGKS